jgi:dihydroflavonol-4-reductase
VVAAICTAATDGKSGRGWITTNQVMSYREAWTLIAGRIGAPAPFATLPRWLGAPAATALGLARRMGIPENKTINEESARYGFLDHCFDGSRARDELGMPSTPVETAVDDAAAWFREHGMLAQPTH